MPNYNKVMLMGHITRDLELRFLPSGFATVSFSVAVNRKWKKKEGGVEEEVSFVDCEAFGKQAEAICQYLSKGKAIFIEGRLKLDKWQDRDGNNKSKLKVVVEGFQFIDKKGEGSAPRQQGQSQQTTFNDDDMPF